MSKKLVTAISIASLSMSELDELEKQEWSADDKEYFSDTFSISFDEIPLGLQYVEAIIDTTGSRSWREMETNIPSSSIVRLYNHKGRMRYGTSPDRFCTPVGLNVKGGSKHTQPGMNGGCFLVGVGDICFINESIRPGGASIGSLSDAGWIVGEGQGGRFAFVETAFNDEFDADNSGYFTQIIRIEPMNSFAKFQKTLRQQRT